MSGRTISKRDPHNISLVFWSTASLPSGIELKIRSLRILRKAARGRLMIVPHPSRIELMLGSSCLGRELSAPAESVNHFA